MGRLDRLVTDNPLFPDLGSTEKKKRQVYGDFVLPDDIQFRSGMEKFIGTREFIGKHEALFCMKNTRLKRGLPRKDEKTETFQY